MRQLVADRRAQDAAGHAVRNELGILYRGGLLSLAIESPAQVPELRGLAWKKAR